MENKPTPSEATNAVIALAHQVAENTAEPAALRELLESRITDLEMLRENVRERAAARGEAFTIPMAPLLDKVDAHFEAYDLAMRHMMTFFENGDAKVLQVGCEQFEEVTAPMLDAMVEYSNAFLTFGPSPYPLMNGARNTLRAIVEGTGNVEALETLINQAVTHHERAIADIEASKHGQKEGYQLKKSAFESLLAALGKLEPVETLEQIDPAVHDLKLALEAITSADEQIFAENTALAPTDMPAANVVINTARGVLSGIYELSVMEETLNWYRNYVEQIEEQFDTAVEGETESVVILEELPKTREIIDLHDEVIADLADALEDFTAENVEPLLEDLEEVVERLKDSSEVYMEAAQREGKLICVGCGHPNRPLNRSCEKCGQKLPQMVDPTMYSRSTFELEERSGLGGAQEEDGVVTENTLRLFEAIYAFYEDKLSEADFRKVIAWSRATVETTDKALEASGDKELTPMQVEKMTEEEVEAYEQNRKLYLDSRHILLEGIDDWSEGLEYLESYIETRHRPTVELGIQRIWIGSQKLYQVQKIAEIADRAVADIEAEERANAMASGQSAPPAAEPEAETEDLTPQTDPGLV